MLNRLKEHLSKFARYQVRWKTLAFLEKEVSFYDANLSVLNIGSGGEIGELVTNVGNKKKWNLTNIDENILRKPDIACDGHNLPFKSNSFDLMIVGEVLPHVKNPVLFCDELYRVCNSGGAVIASVRFLFPINDAPKDFYRFTEYGLNYLFHKWKIQKLKSQYNVIETVGVFILRACFTNSMKPFFIFSILLVLGLSIFKIGKCFNIHSKFGCAGYFLVAEK